MFVISMTAVEADAFNRVVVVSDLEHAVLGVAALNARLRVPGDGDALVLGSVGDGETIMIVVTLLEVTSVSGLHFLQAGRFEVVSGLDGDVLGGSRNGQLQGCNTLSVGGYQQK